jgi:hypothetical protein
MKTTLIFNGKKIEVDYDLVHTTHSRRRASQRGLADSDIMKAVTYGREYFKQGYIFVVVEKNNLPEELDPDTRKKLNNLVVVLAGNSNHIVTCYKCANASRYIRRKQDFLFRCGRRNLSDGTRQDYGPKEKSDNAESLHKSILILQNEQLKTAI